MKNNKKISFCITCMNRLSHIKQTLEKNIEDNFLPDDVEFVLLDYNSSDGLEEWVRTLQKYIDLGILHYYRIETPECYHRSHSRNVAFRLASGEIVCNLDADNFLGKGFAEYIIKRFADAADGIFITTLLDTRDIYGRFCALSNHFMNIRGYNELLVCYGAEDNDIYKRLIDSGLRQEVFADPAFCSAVTHSCLERVSQEQHFMSLETLYISYDSTFRTKLMLLKKDDTYEIVHLINNALCHFNISQHFPNRLDAYFDSSNRIVVEDNIEKGRWIRMGNVANLSFGDSSYTFALSDKTIKLGDSCFYTVFDEEWVAFFIMFLSDAINYTKAKRIIDDKEPVNPSGFGQGTVYKNFDYTNPIILD